MANAFGSCRKRSRLSSVRNLSERSRSWPLSPTSTPERQKINNNIGSTSPFNFGSLKEVTESPLLTSTPWSYRHHSLDSLLQESASKPWMSDDWLTPIQTKEINIDGLIKPEIDQLCFKDIAKNLFEEPDQDEICTESCKSTQEISGDSLCCNTPQQTCEPSLSLVKRLYSFEQSSDKSLVDSGYISSSMDTTFLIGKKMGLRHLDILSELLNVEPNIVDQIVSYLSPDDIESVSCVCSTWREYCDESKLIQDVRKLSAVSQRNKENHRRTTCAKLTTSMNIPLKVVQSKECPSPTKTNSSNQPSSVRHNIFRKAASELLSDESLSKCPRCCSPAKLSMNRQRGNCKRRSCMFEFCVSCQIRFHSGSPCKVTPKRSVKKCDGVGSKNSKNNLRRL